MSRLVSFDFDGTLYHTPNPIEGQKQWENIKGEVWPYNGWWGRPDSIDPDVFYIPVNNFVHSVYKKELAQNSHIFLATGRLERPPKMRERVLRILANDDIKFSPLPEIDNIVYEGKKINRNGVYLNTGGDTYRFKTTLFERMIRLLNPTTFVMLDDRHEHIVEFEKWAKRQPCRVEIIDVTKTDKTPKIVNNR